MKVFFHNMCKAVALFYNIRIGNKRFITIRRTNEYFLKHYNERKTWESCFILHSIEIYQVKSFHC